MQPNVEKTKSFYESYVPCKCGDCKFLYANIEQNYKALFDYLVALGIDPLKPIESMSSFDHKNSKMIYTLCYLMMGNIEENYSSKIGNVEIKENFVDFPYPEVKEPYFVLTVGELILSRTSTWNRHMTRDERIHVIRNCISKEDPMGLIVGGSPMDEYSPEAKSIDKYLCISKSYLGLWKIVRMVFEESFSDNISEKVCKLIARNICCSIDYSLFEKEMNEYEELKGKVFFNDDYSIELVVHDNFKVKQKNGMTFINDKFFYDIEDQDLIDSFVDFVTNNDTIYVQYNHRHFSFFGNHYINFKELSKKKFDTKKLKHKNDIKVIFDNNGVIEYSKI